MVFSDMRQIARVIGCATVCTYKQFKTTQVVLLNEATHIRVSKLKIGGSKHLRELYVFVTTIWAITSFSHRLGCDTISEINQH